MQVLKGFLIGIGVSLVVFAGGVLYILWPMLNVWFSRSIN